jgi:hypothetical protein
MREEVKRLRKRGLFCRLISPKLGYSCKPAEAKVNNKFSNSTIIPLNQIFTSKKHALRRGVWFRALSLAERGILDLTMRYVATIRSATLAKVVTAILEKLKNASESIVDRLVREVGFSLAKKIGGIAQSWGNGLAASWGSDAGFARYLAVAHLNGGSH